MRAALVLLAAALPAAAGWDEHVFVERKDAAWTLRWSAYKRSPFPRPCSSGHLDSAAADWEGLAAGADGTWTLEGAPAAWRGKRLGARPAGPLRGTVRIEAERLVVDLRDAEGRPFRGNGRYRLEARTPDRAYGRR